MTGGQEPNEQLERLTSVADAALAHLGTAEMLDELLERVRSLLDVDTVAVLLRDPSGRELVAHAACGLEEEVRQGVRVPIGRGFAGQIAATKSAVILDHVGPDVVVNPILWTTGVQSMLGVPLVVSGDLIGVMHVGTLSGRTFTDEDTQLLQVAADRIALAITTQRLAVDNAAAQSLQRSLLPTSMPSVEGLEFASRFVTAEEFGVGGDWYDAFSLPSGHVGIVMGDVAGHGLRAAVVMGRIRSALRAYAIECDSPAEVLARVDRKFAHFEPNEMATVLYARIDPDRAHLTVSSAGHLPPVVITGETPARFLDADPDPPIGAHLLTTRTEVTVAFPIGTLLACYTDGLVERRGRPIQVGLERLLLSMRGGPVDDVCSEVMRAMVGGEPAGDDTAILAVRRVG